MNLQILKPSRAVSGYFGLVSLALMPSLVGAPKGVSFSQPGGRVEAYDYVEVAARVDEPDTRNAFLDATLSGSFAKADGTGRKDVEGFCDSVDGSSFLIRFMPASPGDYSYSITYRQGAFVATQTGKFTATAGHRRGPVRVDPEYRWHFIWEGTGEHCFFNGPTAFWLMGWR